jgi:predicted RNA-binding Zn ribbon-like protein
MAASHSSEPGGRTPAPEPLRLVQRFVNTNDREGGHDAFDRVSATTRWFRDVGLRIGRVGAQDVERIVDLREALRWLLLANNGRPLDEWALATVNEEARRSGVAVRFTAELPELELPGSGLDYALGGLLSIVFDAQIDGTWTRLKACRRDVCQWAFYDHSKNRLGTWCTMDICGNRVKTSAYWHRLRQAQPRR